MSIADAKGTRSSKTVSQEPEDNPPRSRLFVSSTQAMVEEDITKLFQNFDGFDYCKFVKNNCAFVKFHTASTAALAMENVNQDNSNLSFFLFFLSHIFKITFFLSDFKLKVVVADPKSKRSRDYYPPGK